MFVGREKELKIFDRLYESNNFEFLVMYGRRRVGKTEILKEFSKKHKVLFFSALEKKSNLNDFTRCMMEYFNDDIDIKFNSFSDALKYFSDKETSQKKVLIIDEFPYIAKEEKEVKSILQHTIDHIYKDKNILLVLCGSSVSFMVNEVMGSKSPLYGRATSIMEILPFDYDIVDKFLPNYSNEDKILTYGILGGIPYYLSQFKDNLSIEENIARKIIDESSTLREEPITLLKSELREPSTYNSIIEVISNGTRRLNEIAGKVGMEVTKVSVYINNLIQMGIIEKITPCGKNNGKISQYIIKDIFFMFWYRFIFASKSKIELMESIDFAKIIKENLPEYMGTVFERICMQYIKQQAKKGNLPFIPSHLGKWWGTNQKKKVATDIDILGIDKNKYMFCECKFRNKLFDINDLNQLIDDSNIFEETKEKYFFIISKSGFTKEVLSKCDEYNLRLLTIENLFSQN